MDNPAEWDTALFKLLPKRLPPSDSCEIVMLGVDPFGLRKMRLGHFSSIRIVVKLGEDNLGGGFDFFYFHPYLGKWSNLTSIFFKWVETTN